MNASSKRKIEVITFGVSYSTVLLAMNAPSAQPNAPVDAIPAVAMIEYLRPNNSKNKLGPTKQNP